MRDFEKSFNRTRRLVNVIFAVVFALFIAWFVAVGFVAYKGITLVGEADWSDGLRGVVEKAWCGQKGCLK